MNKYLQLILALFGAMVCIFVAIQFSGAQDQMWPTPGLYLVEIALLGSFCLASLAVDTQAARMVPWGISGILLTFVILGGFSVGTPLRPALLAFLAVAVLRSQGTSASPWRGPAIGLAAALLQAAVMFAIILFLEPNVQW
ncbi:MAG: hypothetical protein OEZ02_08600 [Anaerolineae bacterium]|nr:hypothetical protein [Anaerolineae bacterium]